LVKLAALAKGNAMC